MILGNDEGPLIAISCYILYMRIHWYCHDLDQVLLIVTQDAGRTEGGMVDSSLSCVTKLLAILQEKGSADGFEAGLSLPPDTHHSTDMKPRVIQENQFIPTILIQRRDKKATIAPVMCIPYASTTVSHALPILFRRVRTGSLR